MIVTAGELLAEFVSHQTDCGLEQVGLYSGPYPSGAPAIFIDQAARVGAKTKMIGSVGADPFGRMIISRLSADGVSTADIEVLPDKRTGAAIVSYYSNGDRIFAFFIEGTATPHVAMGAAPDESFILHVSGASLAVKEARDVLLELGSQANASGGYITFDPNVRSELLLNSEASTAVTSLIALSRIVLPSEADLAIMFPDQKPEQACQNMVDEGVEIVVLKLGKNGAKIFTQNQQIEIAGYPAVEVDPTGAGDCFCGAFLGLLDQGYDLECAGKMANAAGAIHVTERGPMEKNPTLNEIEQFMKTRVDG